MEWRKKLHRAAICMTIQLIPLLVTVSLVSSQLETGKRIATNSNNSLAEAIKELISQHENKMSHIYQMRNLLHQTATERAASEGTIEPMPTITKLLITFQKNITCDELHHLIISSQIVNGKKISLDQLGSEPFLSHLPNESEQQQFNVMIVRRKSNQDFDKDQIRNNNFTITNQNDESISLTVQSSIDTNESIGRKTKFDNLIQANSHKTSTTCLMIHFNGTLSLTNELLPTASRSSESTLSIKSVSSASPLELKAASSFNHTSSSSGEFNVSFESGSTIMINGSAHAQINQYHEETLHFGAKITCLLLISLVFLVFCATIYDLNQYEDTIRHEQMFVNDQFDSVKGSNIISFGGKINQQQNGNLLSSSSTSLASSIIRPEFDLKRNKLGQQVIPNYYQGNTLKEEASYLDHFKLNNDRKTIQMNQNKRTSSGNKKRYFFKQSSCLSHYFNGQSPSASKDHLMSKDSNRWMKKQTKIGNKCNSLVALASKNLNFLKSNLVKNIFLSFSLKHSASLIFNNLNNNNNNTSNQVQVKEKTNCLNDQNRQSYLFNQDRQLSADNYIIKPKVNNNVQQVDSISMKRYSKNEEEKNNNLPKANTDSLHGLRFLSMIWVIVMHSYSFALNWITFTQDSNPRDVYKTFTGQFLFNGSFACDTFLLIGGFLLAYLAIPEKFGKREGEVEGQIRTRDESLRKETRYMSSSSGTTSRSSSPGCYYQRSSTQRSPSASFSLLSTTTTTTNIDIAYEQQDCESANSASTRSTTFEATHGFMAAHEELEITSSGCNNLSAPCTSNTRLLDGRNVSNKMFFINSDELTSKMSLIECKQEPFANTNQSCELQAALSCPAELNQYYNNNNSNNQQQQQQQHLQNNYQNQEQSYEYEHQKQTKSQDTRPHPNCNLNLHQYRPQRASSALDARFEESRQSLPNFEDTVIAYFTLSAPPSRDQRYQSAQSMTPTPTLPTLPTLPTATPTTTPILTTTTPTATRGEHAQTSSDLADDNNNKIKLRVEQDINENKRDESMNRIGEEKRSQEQVEILTLNQVLSNIIHRYVRMMPLMMAIIGLCTNLLRYMGDGPNWNSSTIMFDNWCRKNWWLNALSIHNLHDNNHMCLSHSWYTAVDIQLFLVGQLILYVLFRNRNLGIAICIISMLGSQLFTGIQTFIYKLPTVPLLANFSLESMNYYYGEIYIKPYCRVSPYLIGMLLAYFMRTSSLMRINLRRWQVLTGWTLALLVMLAIVLAPQPAMNGKMPTLIQLSLYSSLARPIWSCAIAWIIFANMTNHGGFLGKFLSAPCFIPFSRLNYPVFLIHPVIMAVFYGNQQGSLHFSHYLMVYLILGNIVITYALAFILSALIELPILSIERAFKRSKQFSN